MVRKLLLKKNIGKKSAEEINRNPTKWSKTLSLNLASQNHGNKKVYQLPNRLYVWTK
jgi:hypothetical protein